MKTIFLGLTLTPKVGWKTIYRLVQAQLDQHCWQLTARQWQKEFPFLSTEQAEHLYTSMDKERLVAYQQRLQEQAISFITIADEDYPALLREIAQPPWLLFLKGKQSLLGQIGLAVVGSRKVSSYGRKVTERLVPLLVEEGLAIVSGLALGIDALAHQAALQAQGNSMAVLGCGIDIIYPEQNKSIYQQLAREGLLLSEYPPGTLPRPGFFPSRNRIIAGLTYGVIVIEAAKKSGSLITAHYALEEGREVFAVPGSIFNGQSVGTNLLIQQNGAKLITNHEDILQELEHVGLPLEKAKGSQMDQHLKRKRLDLNEQELQILQLLDKEKRHMNELWNLTSIPLPELSSILLRLELKGLIMTLPGSYYQGVSLSSLSI